MPRAELHDVAVNKALTYALRLGLPLDDPDKLKGGLELWYLKTRFAYRVLLGDVVSALLSYPGGNCRWAGGETGSWVADSG